MLQLAAMASTVITLLLVVQELRYLDSAAAYVEYLLVNFAFYFGVIGAALLVLAQLRPAIDRFAKGQRR